MAILKIAKMGAPILGEVAKEVLDPTCEETASVASNMLETLIDAGGLGLAAPPAERHCTGVPGVP